MQNAAWMLLPIAGILAFIALLVLDERGDIEKLQARVQPSSVTAYMTRLPSMVGGRCTDSPEPVRPENLTCRRCGQGPMAREEDLKEHIDAKHRQSPNETDPSDDQRRVPDPHPDVATRGNLVDDYAADWIEDRDTDGGDIELATSERSDIEERKLEKFWGPVLQMLGDGRPVEFGPQDHYAQLRGKNIAQEFRKAATRLGIDVDVHIQGRTATITAAHPEELI